MKIRRNAKNKLRPLRTIVPGLGLLTLMVGSQLTPAHADTHSYASERRQIKACVLVSSAAPGIGGGPQNVTPHVFYVMDRRTDLKPAGWEFVNPMAPTTITGEIYNRWQVRGGVLDPAFANTPAGIDFRIGQPLSKNFGAYWEVNLDTASSTDLAQFDVVLMAYHNGQTQFTSDEREKLRRFVDGGGTVWLEDEGGFDLKKGGSYGGGEFIVDLGFATPLVAGTFPTPATKHHPLINFPYSLSQVDVLSLGAAGVQYDNTNPAYKHHAHQGLNNAFTGVNGLANPRVLVPVIWAGTSAGQLPFISAGDYGAGHIVVSSGGVATGINGYVGGVDVGEGGNSALSSGESMLAARPTDLKFAYNLISWTSSVPTGGVNARRTNGTQENVGAQLGTRWATIPPAAANVSAGSGAVIHKGVVFYVDGNNVLHAYDASPQQDLDGDGNPDDGIPDYIYGAPYDEIWNKDLKGILGTTANTRVSTPTIASVVNPVSGIPQDILMVSTSIGATMAFDAFPTSGSVLSSTASMLWAISSPDAGPADLAGDLTPLPGVTLPSPGPAFSDGIVFTLWDQTGNDVNHHWHVAAIDPLTGNEVFQESGAIGPTVAPSILGPGILGPGVVPGIPNPVGSVTVGYVRDDQTGALDKMIYVPTRTPANTDTGAGSVHGVWFSTKGEPLEPLAGSINSFVPRAQRGLVPWYLTAPPGNGIDLRPVVYKRDAAGVLTRLRYLTDFTVQYIGPPARREVTVTITVVNAGDTFNADYTLDWPADPLPIVAGSGRPTANEMNLFSRRNMAITPDKRQGVPNAPAIHLFGSPTLSPQDYLFMGGGDYPGGDRLYAYHEQFSNGQNPNGSITPKTKLAWMFFANAPDDDFNIGAGGLPGRMHNQDTFLPPKNPPFGGLPDMFVTDFEQIGSPAYANGVVYVTGYCHLRSDQPGAVQNLPDAMVVMALRANPNTSFTAANADGSLIPLGPTGTQVRLRQPDLVNSTALSPKYIELAENQQFTVDRASNSIQITDFHSGSGDAFNTALPIFVGGTGNNPGIPVYNRQTGYGILDNVLWWMTVPLSFNNIYPVTNPPTYPYPAQWQGSNPPRMPLDVPPFIPSGLKPASGPSIIGDTLYYGSTTGQVVSIDLSGINQNGGQTNAFKTDGTSRVNAQAALKGPDGFAVQQPIFSPPVATTGIVAVGTSQGLVVLDNQLTLIADNNRLIEVRHDGTVAWTADATSSYRLVQSTGQNAGQIATQKVSLSRPNMAHRYTLNDFLVADTGNNRVIELDKGGVVTWELSRLSNDLRFLRDNDPVALNQPTDIQTYNTSGTGTLSFTSPVSNATYTYKPGVGGSWFAIHYIIADSGNFRALEVVDIYDATGAPVVMVGSDGTNPTMLRQVVFTTRSYGEQNQQFRYRTIQQFTSFENGFFRTYMVAAVDNVRQAASLDPATSNVGTNANAVKGPGGSLMIVKRYPPAGQGNDGDTAALINSLVYTNLAGTTVVTRQTINNPRWFKQFNVANPLNLLAPSLHYALADANGVYILKPGTGALVGEAVVEWSLSNDDYYYLTGRHLNATSIQKLEQSDYDTTTNTFYPRYLITNGFTGHDNIVEVFGLIPAKTNVIDGEVHGEVVEVRSDYYYSLNGGHFNTVAGGYRAASARHYAISGTSLVANPLSAITWMVPNETIPPPPVPPAVASAIVRKIGIGTNGTGTGLLEQPTFSDRPF